MRNHLTSLLFAMVSLIAVSVSAHAVSLQLGVAVDVVPVDSNFNGTEVVIFGSIEGAAQDPLYRGEYDVVIKVSGDKEDIVIRQKERIAGIWINNKSQTYKFAPSFYSVLSSKPLSEIADQEVLGLAGIGIGNLGTKPDRLDDEAFKLDTGEFPDALRRIRQQDGLFSENPGNLTQLSPSLFRAKLYLPANTPIGDYVVSAHLFRGGKDLANTQANFQIRKVGFERWIYELAHEQSLLYGIMAVLIAIFTGWAANAIFRKN